MTVTGEKSAAHQSGIGESSTQMKQQWFAVQLIWIFPPDYRTTQGFVYGSKVSHATNAAKYLFLCRVWPQRQVQNKDRSQCVIFSTVSRVDVSTTVTFLWVRHLAQTTQNSQLRTSKCNFTSCKATGHLPCFFTDWDDWGQLTVLRGNTINYTPHGGDSERLTTHTCRSSWKRNIRDRGKHGLWRGRPKEKERDHSVRLNAAHWEKEMFEQSIYLDTFWGFVLRISDMDLNVTWSFEQLFGCKGRDGLRWRYLILCGKNDMIRITHDALYDIVSFSTENVKVTNWGGLVLFSPLHFSNSYNFCKRLRKTNSSSATTEF